jgi:Raf kinase inhibitor-like YbhB/YbcL family protein
VEADAGGNADASAAVFTLTSPAVEDVAGCGPDEGDRDLCDLFPAENTGLNGAANVSPQFDWTGVPAGTQSFAIALHDLSNLNGSDPFTHWVMWNIPGSATGLPAELPEGTNPGVPDANTRQVSFRGNQAFAGSGAAGNVYEFVLFALGTETFDPGSTNPDQVENAIAGSSDVLGTATLRARSTPND